MEKDYVIWSFEHEAWWGPAECGYVRDVAGAGRYSAVDAGRIVTNSIMGDEVAIYLRTAELNGRPTVGGLWDATRQENR